MIKIKRNLTIIKYCFIALIGLIFLLILSGFGGIQTLTQRQKWVDHTNYTMNQIEVAEREFNVADFAGRNQMVSGVVNDRLPELRKKAVDNLKTLKETVADNPVQLDNLNSLEAAIINAFKSQDEQAVGAIKADGKIIYSLDATAKRIQYIESVETLFTRLKINEMNLLRIDRMPRLALWQWRIVYFTVVVMGLLLTVTVVLFVFHMRLMNRNIEAIEYLEQVKENTNGEFIRAEETDKFLAYLAQDSSVLDAKFIS